LGRWAQVYFTSPPEKREEAVGELLRELQGQPAPEPSEPTETIRIVEAVVSEPAAQCAECGHPYTVPQRFCGMCGAALEGEQPRVEHASVPQASPRLEPIFTHAELPSLSPVHESPRSADESFSEIRWLREKSLTSGQSSWTRSAPRYAPAIVAMLAIGVLFYAQSRPQKGAAQPSERDARSAPAGPQAPALKTSSTPAPTAAAPTENAPLKTPDGLAANATPRASSPTEAAPASHQPAPTAQPLSADNTKPQSSAARTPRVSSPEAPAPQAADASNAQNGAAELALAEDFLNGRTHPRNSAEATKYLWRAVGKENPSAILLLSDMYLAGDGVPRSCDQARLLLSAAARKGVPQAAEKLRYLLRSGCPK
jgi:cytoskeletal protein RodZ